jgi:hypothetical protein
MVKKISLILILFFINSAALFSQYQQTLVQQMIQAFRQLDYGTAQKIGKQITADFKSFTPIELLETHKILGVIAYQDGDIAEANAQFEQALSIDRTAQLDSVYVSPKIIQFFKDLKLSYNSKKETSETGKLIQYRYLVKPDPRPAATLRSMVLPGWGQLYKNDKTKGYILIGSTASVAVATVIFHVLHKDFHNQYLKATDPKIIEQKYDKYNSFYKLRNNTALVAGGIWLYAFFDALLTEPKEKQLKVSFLAGECPCLYAQFSF